MNEQHLPTYNMHALSIENCRGQNAFSAVFHNFYDFKRVTFVPKDYT